MPYRFTLDDVAFLASAQGARALARCAQLPLSDASWVHDVATARAIAGQAHAPAVLETIILRRKADSASLDAKGWFYTDGSLQQASASPVARHRARRLAGHDIHDVTCSIGADLVVLAREAHRCVGSDLDEVRLAMARHNCAQAHVDPLLLRADARTPTTRDTVVVADPARRDRLGRRLWRPGDFRPPMDELAAVYAGRDLAVKCAPGIDRAAVPWAGEVEVISLDGQVREACLYTGGLAETTTRATVLSSTDAAWSVTDQQTDEVAVAEPGEWIIDPDGAIVRAGLVRHYGARHGLWQLDERIAYLTGDVPPSGVRAFRVLEYGAYSEKSLRAVLRRRDIGRLEILVRGVDVDPHLLRRRLRLRGAEEASVVLTRIGRSPTMLLCTAERIPNSTKRYNPSNGTNEV